jgi:L-malate glycosyltransferase
MSKLRILHLSSERTWRGGEQQIAYLIDELKSLGADNVILARQNSVFEQHCRVRQILCYAGKFSNSFDLPTAFKIRNICLKEKIDLVHMHSAKSHALGVLSALVGNNTPLILSRRVDFVPKNNFLTRWKYNHSSIARILCVSHKICDIMKGYVDHPEKCITVHSGIDLNKFTATRNGNILRKEFHIPDDYLLIGNTSALENHKDYFTFLKTIHSLVKQKLPIKGFIIGHGSLQASLENFAKELGIEKEVYFTGFRKDILDVLPSLDIFLITSEEEGLGTSVLDAFAACVPVVATAAGGIPEMVQHEVTGLLAPVKDHTKLAENIQRLMADTLLKNKLISQARERLNDFSKEKTAARTLAVYEEVLSQQ